MSAAAGGSLSEFELIRRWFSRPTPGTLLGGGDDCALLRPTEGEALAVTTDMLVEGIHFSPGDDPRALGHKTLAVNLSDLAAMGARPRWFTLALAMPRADAAWLEQFSDGLYGLAERFAFDLVGGDTTRGPLTLCVQAIGEVPPQAALRRSGAVVGDDVWVSGELGAAAVGLAHRQGRFALEPDVARHCLARLDCPEPRVALGLALRGTASAAIDVSDGLVGDLGHVCAASGVAAELHHDRLPYPSALARSADLPVVRNAVLAGGDDYELVFTAAQDARVRLSALAQTLGLPLTCIGRIVPGSGVRVLDGHGRTMALERAGHDHFG